MQNVDQPYFPPGCCVLGGGGGPENGPYVDLLQADNQGNRLYVSHQRIIDLTRFIGGAAPVEVEAYEEVAAAKERLEAELEQVRFDYLQLESAVAYTLSIGAVFDKKTLRPRLRKPPQGMVLRQEGEPYEVAEQEDVEDAGGGRLPADQPGGAARDREEHDEARAHEVHAHSGADEA